MNAKNWDIAKQRQHDMERAAQRHRAAGALSDDPPLRHKVGEWMVKTGTRLLETNDTIGVPVTGDHRHATG